MTRHRAPFAVIALLTVAACGSPAQQLDRCARRSSATELLPLPEKLRVAEQTLLRLGVLAAPTREGYAALQDSIDARRITWDGFCDAFREDGMTCWDLATPSSIATYPFCFEVLRVGYDNAEGQLPVPPQELVPRLTDRQLADPRVRVAVTSSALWILSVVEGSAQQDGESRR